MSNGIVFHTKPQSRSRLVRWRLEELGQPCRTEVPGYGPSVKAVDCLAINPVGKMPAPGFSATGSAPARSTPP